MARKNKYSDAEIVALIDEYVLRMGEDEIYVDEFNAWTVAEYWKENGYPDMNGQYLNRREASRKRIEQIKETIKERTIAGIYVDEQNIYKNFDYMEFYNNNKNKQYCGLEKLGRAINDLRKQLQSARATSNQMKKELAECRSENEKLKKELEMVKEDRKEMRMRLADAESAASHMLTIAADSFAEIIDYEEAKSKGKDKKVNNFLKKHSYLGEKDKETPTMKEIMERFPAEELGIIGKDGKVQKDALDKRLLGD